MSDVKGTNGATETAATATPAVVTPVKKDNGPNRLAEAHAAFIKAGGKPADGKTTKALVDGWKKAAQAKEKAEEAFTAASKAESETVKALILALGKGRLKIAGEVYIPMSRGETFYLRQEGGGEVRDLG